jgi:hypothetical protein
VSVAARSLSDFDAMVWLRANAFATNRPIEKVARDVLAGRIVLRGRTCERARGARSGLEASGVVTEPTGVSE